MCLEWLQAGGCRQPGCQRRHRFPEESYAWLPESRSETLPLRYSPSEQEFSAAWSSALEWKWDGAVLAVAPLGPAGAARVRELHETMRQVGGFWLCR